VPNGHGRIPRYGSPLLLLCVLGLLLLSELRYNPTWARPLAGGVAVLFGWRLAWHQFLYPVMDYGGAYRDPEEIASARNRYRIATVVYSTLAVAAVFFGWPRALQ
jgi:hypothetical protein